jgi:MYXO-CTERM domain-containing protein
MKPSVLLVTFALAVAPANAALIGFWGQDELSGPIIDLTGNHPAGIATGSPVYGLPGVPNGPYGAINITAATGTAIEYGPTVVDEFFTVGTDNVNPVMNLNFTDGFTVMGWMNPYAPSVINRSYKVLSTGSAAAADRGWGLALRLPQLDGTGSSVRFTTFGIADNDSAPFSVTFGTWIHLAATYNNGVITYFLNGTMLDSDTSSFGNDTASARLVIGSRLGGNDVDQLNGQLDGIRVYNTVLTEAEIRAAAVESVSVPEPSSAFLGLTGLLAFTRRRRP